MLLMENIIDMISKLKKIFVKLLKSIGYEIMGSKRIVKHNNFDAIIEFLLKEIDKTDKKIIFDVGANLGQSIERFRRIDENSIIHSFEPTPDLALKLKSKYKYTDNIFINDFGLGSKNDLLQFNSFNYHKINSFIDLDEKSKFAKSRMIVAKSNQKNFTEKISVKVKKLDDYCHSNNINKINLIKIDTQGFEEEVLNGALNLIKENKIDIIELELVLGFAYKKTLSFYSIEKILNEHSYKLIAIRNSGNVISFSNFQTDLIYVKNDIYENIRKLHVRNEDIANVMSKTDRLNPHSY